MGDLHKLFDNPNFRDQDYNEAFAALKADRSYTTSSGAYYDVLSVSFSPDGRRIVSGSYDRTIRIWDAESGQELSKLEGHSGVVLSVSFSPDGRRIVSGGDRTIRIWDAESGQELLKLKPKHNEDVLSPSFSPDGRRIVSDSDDETIRIWDAESGQELRPKKKRVVRLPGYQRDLKPQKKPTLLGLDRDTIQGVASVVPPKSKGGSKTRRRSRKGKSRKGKSRKGKSRKGKSRLK
jgi:WD40 repeat protein